MLALEPRRRCGCNWGWPPAMPGASLASPAQTGLPAASPRRAMASLPLFPASACRTDLAAGRDSHALCEDISVKGRRHTRTTVVPAA